ncbi:hypothetical protein U1Q18_035105 [Sarracenia purpurea var. burkii]
MLELFCSIKSTRAALVSLLFRAILLNLPARASLLKLLCLNCSAQSASSIYLAQFARSGKSAQVGLLNLPCSGCSKLRDFLVPHSDRSNRIRSSCAMHQPFRFDRTLLCPSSTIQVRWYHLVPSIDHSN